MTDEPAAAPATVTEEHRNLAQDLRNLAHLAAQRLETLGAEVEAEARDLLKRLASLAGVG